jgi:hypothetical protein
MIHLTPDRQSLRFSFFLMLFGALLGLVGLFRFFF